jgi:hypothetical protein
MTSRFAGCRVRPVPVPSSPLLCSPSWCALALDVHVHVLVQSDISMASLVLSVPHGGGSLEVSGALRDHILAVRARTLSAEQQLARGPASSALAALKRDVLLVRNALVHSSAHGRSFSSSSSSSSTTAALFADADALERRLARYDRCAAAPLHAAVARAGLLDLALDGIDLLADMVSADALRFLDAAGFPCAHLLPPSPSSAPADAGRSSTAVDKSAGTATEEDAVALPSSRVAAATRLPLLVAALHQHAVGAAEELGTARTETATLRRNLAKLAEENRLLREMVAHSARQQQQQQQQQQHDPRAMTPSAIMLTSTRWTTMSAPSAALLTHALPQPMVAASTTSAREVSAMRSTRQPESISDHQQATTVDSLLSKLPTVCDAGTQTSSTTLRIFGLVERATGGASAPNVACTELAKAEHAVRAMRRVLAQHWPRPLQEEQQLRALRAEVGQGHGQTVLAPPPQRALTGTRATHARLHSKPESTSTSTSATSEVPGGSAGEETPAGADLVPPESVPGAPPRIVEHLSLASGQVQSFCGFVEEQMQCLYWARGAITQLRSDVAALRTQVSLQATTIEHLTAEKSCLERKLDEERRASANAIAEQERQLRALVELERGNAHAALGECELMRKKEAAARKDAFAALEQVATLERRTDELRTELEGMSARRIAEADAWERRLAETQARVDAAQAEVRQREADVAAIQRHMQNTEQRMRDITGRLEVARDEADSKEARLGELEERLAELEDGVRAAMEERKAAEALAADEAQSAAAARSEVARLEHVVEELQASVQREQRRASLALGEGMLPPVAGHGMSRAERAERLMRMIETNETRRDALNEQCRQMVAELMALGNVSAGVATRPAETAASQPPQTMRYVRRGAVLQVTRALTQ